MKQRVLGLVCVLMILQAFGVGSAQAADPFLFWQAPETGSFMIAPMGGYTFGGGMEGVTTGLRMDFVFKHLLGHVQGQAVFTDAGVMYNVGADALGRYGPFFLGVGFAGYWLPGKTDTNVPGVAGHVGLHLPSPFDDIFFELAYRPHVLFRKGDNTYCHSLLLSVLFGTGE